MGVFATRSSFRPNPIGLSCVKLERVTETENNGTVLEVSGADLLDMTPIYDIKPYLEFTDSVPDAKGGFSDAVFGKKLNVIINDAIAETLPQKYLLSLTEILEEDPRPAYQNDKDRIYCFEYGEMHIEFKVDGDNLTVLCIIPQSTS